MENESAKIKFEEHFKLYVLLKDKIAFESELLENGVDFYFEEKQPNITSGIRYFLRDVDRPKIDKIVIENGIIVSTETIPSYDYRDQQKAQKIYAITACVVIVIILIVFAIVELFKEEHWLQ